MTAREAFVARIRANLIVVGVLAAFTVLVLAFSAGASPAHADGYRHRHHDGGAGVALGVIGGLVLGTMLTAPGYASPPAVVYGPPAYYYPPPTYYVPACREVVRQTGWYFGQPTFQRFAVCQ